MSEATQVQSNQTATTTETEGQSQTRPQVSILDFIRGWEASVNDGSGVKGCAEKLGLTPETCQARASKYRNPEFEKVDKVDANGNTVYKRAKVGENGETETTDKELAKVNSQGKHVTVRVYATDEAGNKIVKRQALPLSKMPRGGGSRLAGNLDEAFALLAELQGGGSDESDSQ